MTAWKRHGIAAALLVAALVLAGAVFAAEPGVGSRGAAILAAQSEDEGIGEAPSPPEQAPDEDDTEGAIPLPPETCPFTGRELGLIV